MVMKTPLSKFASFSIFLIAIAAALAPVYRAQSLGSTVRVSTIPDGAYYSVDGQIYTHATSAIWPAGSKHILSADVEQDGVQMKTKLTFGSWQYGTTTLPGGNTVAITADPSINEYHAVFQEQYALSLVFFSCPDPAHCPSPGTIYQGTQPYTSDGDIYAAAGATVVLLASPNPGYVFAGWAPGPGQVIQGAVNTVTLHTPVIVRPQFQVARPINLATAPAGLQVLADRAPVTTPVELDWGWNSTHSVGPVSPQEDRFGAWWVFSSWSDGGAPTHAYQVPQVSRPDTLTATYVAGAPIALTTSPPNLKLKIDGRDNWPSYGFVWGVGETHHLEAPLQQTDAQGRVWAFSAWSDGGAAVHDLTVPTSAGGVGIRLNATYTPLGHLTVTSSLPTLAVQVDGTTCATPCDVVRPVGTTVRVSAPGSVPQGDGSRQDFLGWPGSGAGDWNAALTADPIAISANYHTLNRLSSSATPPNGATWSMQPGSPDGYYDAQTTVIVAVTPLPGFRFHQWSGDLSGTRPTGAVPMNAPRAVQAQLDPVPYIAPAGVGNAAGATPQTGVAAGSVVSVYGASLVGSTTVATGNPLAQTLGGATVRAGDRLLPLIFVSPTQINLQLPDDVPLGTQSLTVSAQGQPDVQATFTVVRNAPGLFAQTVGDQSFAMVVHADGSAVTTDSPAQPGELLTVYGTGFGPADHRRPEGFPVPSDPPYLIVDPATVSIGSFVATAENAFAVPGRVGIDAVQFRLGDGAPSGTNANLHVTINGQDSNVVLLPVQ
jgi:uncharacterized protein (TIGR03437 family)